MLGNNFVTVFHAVTTDLELPLPWPVPVAAPPDAENMILVWGGSSSVGQYALQILRHWGYRKLIATGSPKHHELLKSLGALKVFDYRDPDATKLILDEFGTIPFILDCIGSKDGSVAPIAKIAKKGTKAAILLPIIVKDSTETEEPVYEMDVEKAADWADGVDARGVRTHFYLQVRRNLLVIARTIYSNWDGQNEVFKNELQSTIMPTLLAEGIVKPNSFRIVEGKTMLERAQSALDLLRRKEVSAERLVWRVAE